ncbi:MAG: HAMP domain-containing histidine kinase [Cytophagaceae bacterium]|nr:HAMP domain-containing histidine kinase [Cytophagaceae bacterium]
MYKSAKYIILLVIANLIAINTYSAIAERNTILIISSYNPETSQTAVNVSALIDEYKLLGGNRNFNIENMNCKSFPDVVNWQAIMKNILDKYSGMNTPSMIILLGQEAWTSFISQDDKRLLKIPVMVGMASRNAVVLPDSIVALANWYPESVDVLSDIHKHNFVAGYIYEYDIIENINLILEIYPQTKNIALITDNTYGGVALQAHVRQNMKNFPQLNLLLLDGRQYSIYNIVDEIGNLPENTVILLGTWRVDSNEGYFMNNVTYTMRDANPEIPAFSLSTLGLGHWAVGGYTPQYRLIGRDMAQQIIKYFNNTTRANVEIETISSGYTFDINVLREIGYSLKKLPEGASFVNKETSFFEKYYLQIILTVSIFVILLTALLIALSFFVKTKRLNKDLEKSEAELRTAKDRAEESNRLKTAFLANMSHEIRTPLNAIVGFSNILTIGDCSKDETARYNEIIRTNSDLLLNLINNILDFSRLEVNRVKIDIKNEDIVNLCQSVILTMRNTGKTQAAFRFIQPVASYQLATDVNRLQQILLNLLSNAAKFTPEGSITLDFKIEEENNRILFSVTDTGCGIPEDKREIIFERFEKLSEFVQGTGLGLSICKLTINKMGGDIWVDPDYTGGTRFIFTHPIDLGKEDFVEPK